MEASLAVGYAMVYVRSELLSGRMLLVTLID